MKNLFEAATVDEVKSRIARLQPSSERLWGKMGVAQALAHCSLGFETAAGEMKLPRMFLGRILGGFVKASALGDKPLGRNSPTAGAFIIGNERFDVHDSSVEEDNLFPFREDACYCLLISLFKSKLHIKDGLFIHRHLF